MSNMNDNLIDDFGMDYSHYIDSVEPIALVARVSYDNGDYSPNKILDIGSIHHVNGFANDFFNMTLEGYDDGLLVKGIVFGTKAYGIGSCIVVLKERKKEIPYMRAFEGHRVHRGCAVLSLNPKCEGVGINSGNTRS